MEHFIDTLSHDVAIVKEPPSEYWWSTREYYATGIRAMRIKTAPVHGSADWYLENVLPVLQRLVNFLLNCFEDPNDFIVRVKRKPFLVIYWICWVIISNSAIFLLLIYFPFMDFLWYVLLAR